MPWKKEYNKRRPRSGAKVSEAFDVQCCCDTKKVKPLLCGDTFFGMVGRDDRRTEVCSVFGLIRHQLSNVCTWKPVVLDAICNEGKKLFRKSKTIAGQYRVFNRICDVSVGKTLHGSCDWSDFYTAFQEALLEQPSCLLNIGGYYCAVVHHKECFIVLNFNASNSSGLPVDMGPCTAQWMTSLNETMMFFLSLFRSLNADRFSVVTVKVSVVNENNRSLVEQQACPSQQLCCPDGIKLKDCYVRLEKMIPVSITKVKDVNASVSNQNANTCVEESRCTFPGHNSNSQRSRGVASVQGSFHQGHARFGANGGRQCVAISLAAMVSHEQQNVLGWNTEMLDRVLIYGDKFYSDCLTKGIITDKSSLKYLLVTDLPEVARFGDAEYHVTCGDPIFGDVNIEDGELHRQGLAYSLIDGLQKVFLLHNMCFFTYDQRTSAVLHVNDCYVLVDSHARDQYGRTDGKGKSIVMYFPSLDDLVALVHGWALHRATPLQSNDFEITGVCLSATGNSEHTSYGADVMKNSMDGCTEVNHSSLSSCQNSASGSGMDVTFIAELPTPRYEFSILSKEVSQKICSKLNVNFDEQRSMVPGIYGELGPLCQTESIHGDGNCFFRSLSQVLCGNQAHHRLFRLAIVKHMRRHESLYGRDLRREYTSVREYLERSKMALVGSWATEVEIQAAADFMGVHIYTYSSEKWLKFASRTNKITEDGIFLAHKNGDHYEPVLCVKNGAVDCLNLCKLHDLINEYPIQTRNKQKESKMQNEAMGPECVLKTIPKSKRKWVDEDGSESKRVCLNVDVFPEFTGKQQDMVMESMTNTYTTGTLSKYTKKQSKCLSRQRYKVNHNRVKILSAKKLKYASDEKYKHAVCERSIQKYAVNAQHRFDVCTQSRVKYATDSEHRADVRTRSRVKYATDSEHRADVRTRSRVKYATDSEHRAGVRTRSHVKYATNSEHRADVRTRSRIKYATNENHRLDLCKRSRVKYATDCAFREAVCTFSKHKYASNAKFRNAVKHSILQKYHGSQEYKTAVCKRVKKKRAVIKQNLNSFKHVLTDFKSLIKDGPSYVCCVCHRLLFKYQVTVCKTEKYLKTYEMQSVAQQCITKDYLHRCDDTCVDPCKWLDTNKCQLWICSTCDSKLCRGVMPAESVVNNLDLKSIPEQLRCLNSLEQHLVALHIPFMKLLPLPKGCQNGVHGPVTCVPSNISATTTVLPRSSLEGSLLRIKLKRKLTYKGHYEFQFVNTNRIKNALQYLKTFNSYYANVNFNEDWINELQQFAHTENNESGAILEQGNPVAEDADHAYIETDDTLHDRQTHGMLTETCLQPVDIGQEILDQYDNILNIAPAEGNNPVQLLRDKTNEAKSFPTLFPKGGPTYHDFRNQRLTLSRYFNNRILNADCRFSSNVEYIFYAQYMSEVEQVSSNISIAMRKGHKSNNRREIPRNLLNDEDSLKQFLQCDDGYRFLRPVRGTPAYWSGVQKDLFAMVRQLGIPTFFCSFSSADMRWENLLQCMLQQDNKTDSVKSLGWAEKCDLLRRHPVTAARMFDYRWHMFLRKVILSPCEPIGKIVDYFYRVEFQQRGSPHIHAMFWVDNAPQIGKSSDQDVVKFVNKYISCQLPDNKDELYEVVSTVQMHSKRHSKTCRKRNTVCRFNFPRPPSTKTFICRKPKPSQADTCNCQINPCTCVNKDSSCTMSKDDATKILSKLKSAISDETCNMTSVKELFAATGIDQKQFEFAYSLAGKKTQIVLKRDMTDLWVNPYNKKLMKAWNANMDIQYIVDAYACIVYIISYISKTEREMGLLLTAAHREATKHGNTEAKTTLKQIGSVYLHHRDVSAQEAVYRLTNMHLKEASRKVEFICTGDNSIRLSLPLKVLKQKAQFHNLNEDNMWATSNVDRYKARPEMEPFPDMCIAQFVSEYRIIAQTINRTEHCIPLKNNLGFIRKRTHSKPAVVRYARFSPDSNPEKHYQSLLQLFLPYRHDNELKPSNYPTYENFYRTGQCVVNSIVQNVQITVDKNRQLFEKENELLSQVEQTMRDESALEDAWCEMCPEQEAERLECQNERAHLLSKEDDHKDTIPDLSTQNEQTHRLERNVQVMCRTEALVLLRSLNNAQKDVFYQIRQWCLHKVQGKNPQPFHLFITGGAGTGKSHLIRAIHYEATRLLSQIATMPDKVSVLLTAPTGIAAFNLGANTIHSTFSIGIDVKLPYTPLREEKVNTMRTSLSDLQILVIDEISMVDHTLLAYVHGRLRQIKQTGDSPFGRVSIIAVGDFFQLPPVRGKPLYIQNCPVDLWNGTFSVSELTNIVRQKDTVFAEILNRLRKRIKTASIPLHDVKTLKSRETAETSSALHIFPTNAQVEEHNIKQIIACCPDYVSVDALDYEKNRQTGQMQLKQGHFSRVFHSCLPEKLILGKGARVMLIKNIDVADGLVNGVCGTVTDMAHNSNNTYVNVVFVQFDNDKVGHITRKRTPSPGHITQSTAIMLDEERVNNKGGLRKQFPLKLAYACTVHKVQGLTVNEAVVSLKKVFAPGQAYVALSRVKSLAGLIIQDFAEKAIYCRDNIQKCISTMPNFQLSNNLPLDNPPLKVLLMNVQSLHCHILDLTTSIQSCQYDCIAVTETWLPANTSNESTYIEGYVFHNAPRSLAYTTENQTLRSIQQQNNGGVGIYFGNTLTYDILNIPNVNIECIICHLNTLDIILVALYRPPQYPLSLFKQHMTKLCKAINNMSKNIFLMGDWNQDELKTTAMSTFMSNLGYVQCVTEPTTETGTLIDHVYSKTSSRFTLNAYVKPMYFSTHEAIHCTFTETEHS